MGDAGHWKATVPTPDPHNGRGERPLSEEDMKWTTHKTLVIQAIVPDTEPYQ